MLSRSLARAGALLASRQVARFSAAAHSSAAPAAASAAVDPAHKAWVDSVAKLPVTIPQFEWTLEWALPTPVPLHQFEQSPIVIEVKDRNANPDILQFKGANVVGGYPHFDDAKKTVSHEEHLKLIKSHVVEAPHTYHEDV